MSKPTYLGLLNAIAVAEQRGYELLSAWADTTANDEVREVLNFVALREREHAAVFAKRMSELGFSVRDDGEEGFAKRLKKARSDKSDRKKFEKLLGYGGERKEVAFEKFFEDESIDPATGALLGRFIAEERDSGRRLLACYEALCSPQCSEDDLLLLDLADRLDKLTDTLGDLKSLREHS